MRNNNTGQCAGCDQVRSEIRHVHDLLDAHKELDNVVHAAEDRARQLAAQEIDRRLDAMNAFREQLMEERGRYVLRDLHDKLEDNVDARLKTLENMRSNLEGRVWMVGALVVLAQLVIHFWK